MANGEFCGRRGASAGAPSDGWSRRPTLAKDSRLPSAAMVVVDEAEFRRLPSAVALYRAAQAQMNGDRERTEVFALRALDLAGEDDPLGRGAAAGFLALAHWGGGDLEAAHRFWTEAMACLQRAGHAVDAIGCQPTTGGDPRRPGSSAARR